MGIDVKSLRESAVGKSIREQMNKIPPSANGVQSPLQGPMQAMAAYWGCSIRGLTGCLCRHLGRAGGLFAATSKNKAPFLLAVEGRFPMAELQPFLKGKTPRRYRDADVYRLNPTDVTTFAYIKGAADGSTLLLGDETSVLAAIGRPRRRGSPGIGIAAARANTGGHSRFLAHYRWSTHRVRAYRCCRYQCTGGAARRAGEESGHGPCVARRFPNGGERGRQKTMPWPRR